jgi:pilus assembly protein CpaF
MLEDGSRVAAMFPPCAVDGPTLTVRKFTHRFTVDDLTAVGTLSAPMADVLRDAVAARHNILISGGTGTGKTTLLNAVAPTIPPQDRIVLLKKPRRFSSTSRISFDSRRDEHKRRLARRSRCLP